MAKKRKAAVKRKRSVKRANPVRGGRLVRGAQVRILPGGKLHVHLPASARRPNPKARTEREYLVILAPTRKASLRGYSPARNISAKYRATAAGGASRAATRDKKKLVPGKPGDWAVMSVKRLN